MTRPTRIIAEAGTNHNGSLELAIQLVDIAVESGADVVKFQVFDAKSLTVRHAPLAEYQQRNTGSSDGQFSMLEKLQLPNEAFQDIAKHCRSRGVGFLATPFDERSLRFLVNDLGSEEIKIASGEITNGPLLLEAGLAGKPVVLSTGMSTLGEVEVALGVLAYGYLRETGRPSIEAFQRAFGSAEGQAKLKQNVTLLQCTTEYPAPYSEVNLRAMDTLGSAFGLPVGFSDHTPGIAVAIAAAARGAAIIEKHFTISKSMAGPDHKASLEPHELTAMIDGVRQVELALGSAQKFPSQSEVKNRPIARRSLVAKKPIALNETFSDQNLGSKRPGDGRSPMHYWDLLGKRASRSYAADEPICERFGEDSRTK